MLALGRDDHGREAARAAEVLIAGAVENSISGDAFRPGDVLPSRKGPVGRDRQHRRRGPARARRRARARGRGGARNPGRRRDAHRRRPRRARARPAAALHRRRRLRRRPHRSRPRPSTTRSGGCRSGTPTTICSTSKIADVNHISSGPFAGSITAALFLRRFVEQAKTWAHLDIYAWNPSTKPGRPEGGEVQGARALDGAARRAVRKLMLDPRLTPARPDVAASHLKGKVEALRFVEGREAAGRGRPCRHPPRALARRGARDRGVVRRGSRPSMTSSKAGPGFS